jgi:hypothetical protein
MSSMRLAGDCSHSHYFLVFTETKRPACFDVTSQRCGRADQTVRHRKFPGPAGLLPDKVDDAC